MTIVKPQIHNFESHLRTYRKFLIKSLRVVEENLSRIQDLRVSNRVLCKNCFSTDLRYNKNGYFCRNCGHYSKDKSASSKSFQHQMGKHG